MAQWRIGAHSEVPAGQGPAFAVADSTEVQWLDTTEAPGTTFAQLISGPLVSGNLNSLRNVTDGGFAIDINGATQNIGPINFHNVGSFNAAAGLISAALTGATCEYVSPNMIITTTPVAGGAISFARPPASGTDVTGILLLTQAGGAVIS